MNVCTLTIKKQLREKTALWTPWYFSLSISSYTSPLLPLTYIGRLTFTHGVDAFLWSLASSDVTEMDGCAWWNTASLSSFCSPPPPPAAAPLPHSQFPFSHSQFLPVQDSTEGKCDACLLLIWNQKVQTGKSASWTFKCFPQATR